MSQFPNQDFGSDYATLFGMSPYNYNQTNLIGERFGPGAEQISNIVLQLLSRSLDSNNVGFTNPFTTYNTSSTFGRRRNLNIGRAVQGAVASSPELQRLGSLNIANLTKAINVTLSGKLSDEQLASIDRESEFVSGLITSPGGRAVLSQIGLDPSLFVPTANLPGQSAQLLRSISPDAAQNTGAVASLAIALAENAGINRQTGRIDPILSRGFNASAQADILRVLQARGILGIDSDIVRSRLTPEQQRNLARGQLEAGDIFANQIGDTLRSRSGELVPIFETGREVLGINDPEQLFRTIQAVTGGGIGTRNPDQVRQQLEVLRQVADTADIAVESLVAFIDQSVEVARKNGLNTTASAQLSLRAISEGATAAQRFGVLTAGLELSDRPAAEDFVSSAQKAALSAQASPLAATVGISLAFLESEAAKAGISVEEFAGRQTGRSREIIEALLRVEGGKLTSEDRRLLSRANVSPVIAQIANIAEADVRVAFENRDIAQAELANRPRLLTTVAGAQFSNQLESRVVDLKDILSETGIDIGLFEEVAAAALAAKGNATVFERLLPESAREALAASDLSSQALFTRVSRITSNTDMTREDGFRRLEQPRLDEVFRRDELEASLRREFDLMSGSLDPLSRLANLVQEQATNPQEDWTSIVSRIFGGEKDAARTAIVLSNEAYIRGLYADPDKAARAIKLLRSDFTDPTGVKLVSPLFDRALDALDSGDADGFVAALSAVPGKAAKFASFVGNITEIVKGGATGAAAVRLAEDLTNEILLTRDPEETKLLFKQLSARIGENVDLSEESELALDNLLYSIESRSEMQNVRKGLERNNNKPFSEQDILREFGPEASNLLIQPKEVFRPLIEDLIRTLGADATDPERLKPEQPSMIEEITSGASSLVDTIGNAIIEGFKNLRITLVSDGTDTENNLIVNTNGAS